jgi:regulatory protein
MWLAQREHSRKELHDKLLRWVRALETARGLHAAAPAAFPGAPRPELQPLPELPHAQQISELLDELEAAGHLSDARLIESRIHVRAARFGNLRIERELQQLGVAADEPARAALRDSEQQRAQAVWARKFGQPPASAAERARQMRFLAGRGFSADVVRAVLRGAGQSEAEGDDEPSEEA